MKTYTILLILLLAVSGYGQQLNTTYTTTRGLSLVDSSDIFYVYLPEPRTLIGFNHKGVEEDTTESIDNTVGFLNKLVLTAYIDSARANTTIDSLFGRIRMLDADKVPFGSYFYFDFANNDTASAVTYLEDQTPYNRVASDALTSPNFWIDFSDVFKLCHGLEVETVARFAGAADSFRVKYNINLGLPK